MNKCDFLTEWRNSGVKDSISLLNVREVTNQCALNLLFYSDKLPRRNDGRLTAGFLNRYQGLNSDGLYCSGVNLITFSDSLWGQFKPNTPRINSKGKVIKYESPPLATHDLYALKVDRETRLAIANKYQIDPREDLSFWQWVVHEPKIPVFISEGAKKAGALLSQNCVGIGLSGIYGGYRKDQTQNSSRKLIPELEVLAVPEREFFFAFDNDSNPQTVVNCQKAIYYTGKLLEKHKCKVSYLSWSGDCKGIDDWLVENKDIELLLSNKKSLSSLVTKIKPGLPLNNPHVTINQKYLDLKSLEIPPDAKLIGIKSSKGTGKTEIIKDIKEQSEGKILIITHRQTLAVQTSSRIDIPYRKDLVQGQETGSYSLCIDSLHPHANPQFCPEDWAGATIVLDECEQSLWHLLNSNTCKHNRIKILWTLKQLVEVVVSTGGKIFLLDADLSSNAVEFYRSLVSDLPEREVWTVENKFNQINERLLYFYDQSSPVLFLEHLEKTIRAGNKILLQVGAAGLDSVYGTKTLHTWLQEKFPHKKIAKIDADTAINGNLDDFLMQYDVAISSPVLESGLSIEIQHFDSVWAIAQGTQTINGIAQTLSRVRAPIPRYLWCGKQGLNFVANRETSVAQIVRSTEKLAKANIQILNNFDYLDDINSIFSHTLKTWAKYACYVNYQSFYYQDFVVEKLQNEYKFIVINEQINKQVERQVKKKIKSARQENLESYTQSILNVNLEANTKLQQRKQELISTYGETNLSSELILQDLRGVLPKLKLYYYTFVRGISSLIKEDSKQLNQLCANLDAKENKQYYHSPDLAYTLLIAKAKIMEILEINQFVNPNNIFTKNSLIPWFEKLKSYAQDLRQLFGFSFGGKEEPITVLQRFLKTFLDISLIYVGKRGQRGNQQRYYRGYQLDLKRASIFNYWNENNTV